MTDKISERIPAEERREQILAAASLVFGERGYVGATTDQIAKAAGISQPYVVRMFGSKENLFVEVLSRALGKLLVTFEETIAGWKADGSPDDQIGRLLGTAYVNLIEDRGLLLSLMQAFSMGHDPVIGEQARQGFIAIYTMLRDEAGFEPERVRSFLAEGMLLNTLLGLRLPEKYGIDEAATELLECTFQTKLQLVLDVVGTRSAEKSA
ncbi:MULTISPECIES: TetR/AcrR family transcriptional regulator [unclassified Leifsonia]|uniref:TetR/AcrR family transcriptional regulator n=1 Tax=unclassified Leifsonia TaxID=2663824 RepID=UPI000A18FCD9|nr:MULTISPECIES: TetR/AcrR family transcriptional regulator [unclassified Leifsonia]QIZ98274.1 TetR/AcrR family transcriptional regulator [Leifsonia sp. PS1209]